ncbi:MAG: large conductance mechanosensitive channel protein MscL [Oscillospiraceae bacterium]|nr:large conductance mechanosensitive channel protein MscL [Oscillospiraceae bacterium]
MKEPVRAKKFGREFKEFMVRGNAIMLAVGVVIGGAFQGIVNSLVNDILMPLIGLFTAGADFSELSFTVSALRSAEDAYVTITYGTLITAIINFLIIGFVIFLLVKCINSADGAVKKACRRGKPVASPAPPSTKKCPFCISEIPIAATRCAHCTSQLPAEDSE